ncbi:UNVERIFIED_CONTAM: hypothetical protein Sradi_0773600 [Sesamum radiatum]|uniref:SWIM-type domain-containing protein n=1 Tax=Sesamum radiatum TaxID=300843 RepID=A0AAW2VT20_SESRA
MWGIWGWYKYYIIMNGGFKLLFSDDDILEQSLKHLACREITIYVEYKPPAPQEIAVECAEKGKKKQIEKAKKIQTEKGKKKQTTKSKKKVDVEDFFEFLGVYNPVENTETSTVGADNENADEVSAGPQEDLNLGDEDDESESDFIAETDCSDDDDELFADFVDGESNDMSADAVSDSESLKLIWWAVSWMKIGCQMMRKNGESYPVFNPVEKDQAYRAKRQALKTLQGDPDEQFKKRWDYEELRRTNPSSTVILGVNNSNGENRIDKFYVCFYALKQGFLRGCRPIVGVDGCHLKGPHGGILLTAVGVDPNNNLYPIAYVVQRESTDTWEWCLTVLKQDLNIVRDNEFTFISDKQKGLTHAFHTVFPNSAHRSCVRHLHNNFKNAGFRGLAFKNTIWRAARASTPGEFNMRMDEMKQLDSAAFDWFLDKPPHEWSKSHFIDVSKCDMLLNNVCESFNANILDARDKPILTMLEWVREYLMKRLLENRDKAGRKWKGTLCPKIKKALQKQIDKIGDCIPIKANDRHYQVSCYDGSQFSVDLEIGTCTCRMWQLTGIPCKHGCSAIFHQNLMPEDMVNPYYHVDTYKQVYEPAILPISGEMLWVETNFIPPLPPHFGRRPGRPAGARNREPDEPSHTARGCALYKDMQEPGLDQDIMDALFSDLQSKEAQGASSSSKSRKRKHRIYEDPCRAELNVVASTENSQPPILPPVLEEEVTVEEEVAPSVMTEPGPGPSQPSVQGPSMWNQLQMAHNNTPVQAEMTLIPRLNIRAPPPMTGTGLMPCFSTRPAIPVAKTIIREHVKKFVDLSTWPRTN